MLRQSRPHRPPPTSGKRADFTPADASDEAVIAILCRDPKQADRWVGNVTGNRSSHLFGLINGLIWLCGPDPDRIGRLVRQSGLYDAKRHDRNSGGGHSNLAVSIHNAIATWHGTPYKWSTAQPVADKLPASPEPEPEPPDPTPTDKLNALRAWLHCGGLAVMTRTRTHDTDLAVADALIDLALERGRIDGLAIGLERLRSMAGLGSTSTARKALERLSWLITKDEPGDKITKADRYSFNVGAIDWAVELALTPDAIYCRKSHPGKTLKEKIVRFATNNRIYSAHRNHDIFSTGGGGVGRSFGNERPGAGKLLLQLIDLMLGEGLPMSGAQLTELTGRRYRAVCNALAYGFKLGLLVRQQESGGRGRPSYWYNVPSDIEQRIALVAVDLRTYGVGVDRAANGAIGLQMHADRLLNLDELGKWHLDDAQRETLKAWSKVANTEYKGLCQIADLAATLDKGAIKEKIKASAVGADLISRSLQAARQFSGAILVGEKVSIKQRIRLFGHWCSLNGYYELTRQDDTTRLLVAEALKQGQRRTVQPEPTRPPQVHFGDLKRMDQAATFAQRFGAAMPAQVAA